jgi:YHS domain-containing protein
VFAALFWLTARRGATDPVCGMKVDRHGAVTKEFGGETFYFCSERCLHAFEADPGRSIDRGHRGAPAGHEDRHVGRDAAPAAARRLFE